MSVKAARAKPKNDAFAAIHGAAKGLRRVGAISKMTLREYEAMCLEQTPDFDAQDIKRIRERAHVSQPVFARYLNTSESTVQKWETGQKRPSGMALKLLSVVKKHGLEVLRLRAVGLPCGGRRHVRASLSPPASAPQVPTFREQGYPALAQSEWFAAFMPARTPGTVIDAASGNINAALQEPEVRETWHQNAMWMQHRPTLNSAH